MGHDIFFAIWYLLPAAVANMTPIFLAKAPLVRRWSWPMDFGKTYKGQPIFGPHKTWRGLISGMIAATAVVALQKDAVLGSEQLQTLTSAVNYHDLPVYIVGPLMGFGALGGDAVKSFFKRRRGIAAGKTWLGFDQLDYIVGAILVTLPFGVFSLSVYVWMAIIWTTAHLAVSYLGWLTGFKNSPI